MKLPMRRERRTSDLFLPQEKEKGDDPLRDPIERATHLDGNVRLVIRSRNVTTGVAQRAQVDWSLADLDRAIEMLTFIRKELSQ